MYAPCSSSPLSFSLFLSLYGLFSLTHTVPFTALPYPQICVDIHKSIICHTQICISTTHRCGKPYKHTQAHSQANLVLGYSSMHTHTPPRAPSNAETMLHYLLQRNGHTDPAECVQRASSSQERRLRHLSRTSDCARGRFMRGYSLCLRLCIYIYIHIYIYIYIYMQQDACTRRI